MSINLVEVGEHENPVLVLCKAAGEYCLACRCYSSFH